MVFINLLNLRNWRVPTLAISVRAEAPVFRRSGKDFMIRLHAVLNARRLTKEGEGL